MNASIHLPYRLDRWVLRAALGFYFTRIERLDRKQVQSRNQTVFAFRHPNAPLDFADTVRMPASIRMRHAVIPWLVAGLFVTCARPPAAEAQTNTSPARTTVAVMPWLPVEPPPMAPEDGHWLETFRRLVAGDLRHVAALRVLPEDAVDRELARQECVETDNTNAFLRLRKLGETLHLQWVIGGALARTGATCTARTRVVEVTAGESGEKFIAASTNWFELRDQVVGQVLQRLDIAPSPEERMLMGKVWTTSPRAFEWLSQAMSGPQGEAQSAELSRKALAEDPQFIEARAVLAAALYNLGHDEEALREARAALNQKPDHHTAAQLRFLCANLLLNRRQQSEAQQEVTEGLRLTPDDGDLLQLQAALHAARGDLVAASDCLRKAAECDPRNPRIYALLGRVKSRQGDLTNALAHLELAQQLVVDTSSSDQMDIESALAEAYESVGNLAQALQFYRRVLAEARDSGTPESRIKWVEETVQELERRSQPVAVLAEKPRHYSPAELQSALRERLSPDALALAVNPIAGTPEMARWAREIVAETRGDLARARKLFDELSSRPKAAGGASRTAQEVFAYWKDLSLSFRCQEYAKLFVALARSLDLPAFYVHVERDYSDRIVDHDCAVVFAEGKAWLVDPAYAWFGVPHLQFRVLDDLQTIAHHAFQPHNGKVEVALCRAGCSLDPEFTWGRMSLVAALIDADQLDEARKELDAVRITAPEDWRGYQLEGHLAIRQGQRDRGLEWLRKAVEANPDDGNTRLLLGRELFQRGEQAAAREALLAGLRRSPLPQHEEMAREILASIEAALGPGSNALSSFKSPLDARSSYNLGLSFMSASKPDYTEAAKWFRQAAELGDSQAQLVLGLMHLTGRGVPADPEMAVHWFRKSAEGGEAQAMRNLGMAYARGLGVERNPQQALQWIRRAAEAGDAEAQAALGVALYEGVAVPKDVVEALYWLMLAAGTKADPSLVVMNDSSSFSALRMVRHSLKEVELFASPAELAEAKKRVETFRAKQAPGSGAQETPPTPPGNPREDDVIERR